MTSTGVDPIVRQDPSVQETQMISMRTRPIDHQNPDDPETGTTAEMIERGDLQDPGDQVTRPHHLHHLQHQPDQHGKDDSDMGLLLSPTAT